MQVPPLPPARCPQTNLSVQLLRWLPVAHSCGEGGGGAITEFCGLLTDLRWSGAVLAVTVGPDRRVCVLVQSRR